MSCIWSFYVSSPVLLQEVGEGRQKDAERCYKTLSALLDETVQKKSVFLWNKQLATTEKNCAYTQKTLQSVSGT